MSSTAGEPARRSPEPLDARMCTRTAATGRHLLIGSAAVLSLGCGSGGSEGTGSPDAIARLIDGENRLVDASGVADADVVVPGAPRLLFSDLTHGPAGAFVTVWGVSIAADAPLVCGTAACEVVVPWAWDARLPSHGRIPGLQRAVVRFATGSGISLAGANTLPFDVAAGTIHEVSSGANVNAVIAAAGPGDVIYLRAGTYADIAGSSSYSAPVFMRSKRDLSVSCYPGETCVIDATAGRRAVAATGPCYDITISNLLIRGANRRGTAFGMGQGQVARNLRIVGNHWEDVGAGGGGLAAFGGLSDLYVLGNSSLRTGVSGDNQSQNVYFTGNAVSSNVQIMFNHLRDHLGGRHIQFYGHMGGPPAESLMGVIVSYNHLADAPQGPSDGIHFGNYDPGPATSCWIDDALIEGNTINGMGRAGIYLRQCGLNPATVRGNVVSSSGESLWAERFQTASVEDNCWDRAPNYGTMMGVTESGNRTDYPACI